jgi:outer membrane murein-binding lipoprotein Lpp
MAIQEWISVIGIVVSVVLVLGPWMFKVHAKLAVIATRIVDLSEKVERLADAADRLWSLSADHEARLDTHEVELAHVAERLREGG